MLLILVSHILKFVSLSTSPNCSWRQQLFFYTYLVIRRSFDFQNRYESRSSLREGSPVVSISIADSTDFLYGDERDIAKAERYCEGRECCLESEDLLIFGGRSTPLFHGVTSILPDSAPTSLLEATSLRPGRLNLTFRQYWLNNIRRSDIYSTCT